MLQKPKLDLLQFHWFYHPICSDAKIVSINKKGIGENNAAVHLYNFSVDNNYLANEFSTILYQSVNISTSIGNRLGIIAL